MAWFEVIWTDEAIAHLAEHGITPDEFEEVVFGRRARIERSDSTGLPLIRGYTTAGRWLVCVFEWLEEPLTMLPVTAYEPEER